MRGVSVAGYRLPDFLESHIRGENLRLKVSFHFPLVEQGEWLGSLSLSKKNTQ